MILERAVIHVLPAQEAEFEAAISEARGVIAQSPGFRSLRLLRGVERPRDYLMLVEWDSIEDHTVGFRESRLFHQWRGLIGRFFDGEPNIQHFEPLESLEPVGP
jgi:heme-degrading monooxygenase HmoA